MAVLPFACLLTVTGKLGGRVKISSPGEAVATSESDAAVERTYGERVKGGNFQFSQKVLKLGGLTVGSLICIYIYVSVARGACGV